MNRVLISGFVWLALNAAVDAHTLRAYAGQPTIEIRTTRIGSCWEHSLAIGHSNAYRCVVGNEIHDPCYRLSDRSVACGGGLRIVVPSLPNDAPAESHLAYFTLDNGVRCVRPTGTSWPDYPYGCGQHLQCSEPHPKSLEGPMDDYYAVCGPIVRTQPPQISYGMLRAYHIHALYY